MALPFSAYAYFLLWVLGAASALHQISAYISEIVSRPTVAAAAMESLISATHAGTVFGEMTGPAIIVLWTVGGANLLHQAVLYYHLHQMEHEPDRWSANFPNWFATRGEVALRILAFVLLLVSAGKVTPLIDFFAGTKPEFLNLSNRFVSFVLGSTLLFIVLLIWDLFGFLKTEKRDIKESREQICFLITDFFACGYWYILCWGLMARQFSGWAIIGIIGFAVLYIFFVGVRILMIFVKPKANKVQILTDTEQQAKGTAISATKDTKSDATKTVASVEDKGDHPT